MSDYRFRVDEGKLVLQLRVLDESGWNPRQTWRDATVEDIPVSPPFGGQPIFLPSPPENM